MPPRKDTHALDVPTAILSLEDLSGVSLLHKSNVEYHNARHFKTS